MVSVLRPLSWLRGCVPLCEGLLLDLDPLLLKGSHDGRCALKYCIQARAGRNIRVRLQEIFAAVGRVLLLRACCVVVGI